MVGQIRAECAALDAARDVPGVVQKAGFGSNYILLQPLATTLFLTSPQEQLSSCVGGLPVHHPSAAEFCDLVDLVLQLHKQAKLVHLDLRPSNFFRDAAGRFFLSDLGSAVGVGESIDYLKPFAFTYGPMAVIQAMRRQPVQAVQAMYAHDYEQIARVVYVALRKVPPPSPHKEIS
jgi:serine/threonine protein kinase